ncbi:MAG TPA: S8 family serine peptidase [Actinomycetes bacterium]|nr:S8 family serine peptidase [Actinomycetes bacterium]
MAIGRPSKTSRAWLSGTFLTAFAVLISLTTGPVAHGQPQSSGSDARVIKTSQVTLITGDKIFVTAHPNGKQTVSVADRTAGANGAAAEEGTADAAPSYHAIEQNGDVYVWPVDLGIYLDTLLDRELFNVSKLVRQGYADDATNSIPVIVDYKGDEVSGALPGGITRTKGLRSIGAAAGHEAKSKARSFGKALRQQLKSDDTAIERGRMSALARTGPFAGIETVYLDEKVEAELADSVPQIGAPQAWAAGFDGTGIDVAVLDTGIDKTHPDLQGKVVAEANFSSEATANDGNGHGTHVASTVAGSGAASGGRRKGVAPGAELMNGKVLDNFGNGQESWVIAGMEWAATNGADVISMSLQAGITDGTDPVSQAVNQLTEADGVLFTIAAGNFGSAPQTVTSPGAANQALTVGAVDKSDVLAGFSGRGPRTGDFAVKPDITAPGVDIIAARASGTSLGTPVDDFYTMLSGTSMATPHVAGAAAIMKQEFPSLTPAQLKAALMSTAAPGPYTVYQQGAGRVDVARASAQKVYATNAPSDFGYFPYPHDNDQPVTRTLGYANHSDAAVTLDLTVDVTAEDGSAPAPGMITTSASSVTIPAGGTASVDVTVDTRLGAASLYGGVLRAQSADRSVVVRTPVGFYKEDVRYNLTVDGIARDGRDARGISWIDIVNVDDTTRFQRTVGLGGGPVTVRVPPGTYSVMGFLFTYDEPQVFATEATIAGDPEIEVNQDTTYVADARPATEVAVQTQQPTEAKWWVIGTYRAAQQVGSYESLLLASPPIDRMFAAPTEQVTKGDFGFRAKPNLGAPELEISVTPPNAMPLDVNYAGGSPRIDGSQRLELVYAGYGRVQDFEGLDVRGKAVLITRGPLPPVGNPITFAEKVANATNAGAAMAIIHNHSPGLLLIGLASADIPVLSMSKAQGEQLRALLAQGKRLTLSMKGIAQSPYVYDTLFAERGRILDTHTRTMNRSNTVQIDAAYRAQVDSWLAGEVRHAFPPWSSFSFDGARNFNVPFERTEYVSTGDTRWFHVGWGSMTNEHIFEWSQQDPEVTYPQADRISDVWFGQPQHPSVIRTYTGTDNGEPVVREGNTITGFVPSFVDQNGRWGTHDSRIDSAPFRLFENGTQIAQSEAFFGSYGVSGGPASYRAELDVTRTAPFWRLSTNTHTSWTFDSAPPPEGERQSVPLLLVDYNLGALDLQNRAHRGDQNITLTAHRQQGAADAPVTGLTLSVSYDDGLTWSTAPTENLGGGQFAAVIHNPGNGPAQFVSLRVQASDSGGSGIDQTITRAYALDG